MYFIFIKIFPLFINTEGHFMSKAVETSFVWSYPVFVCIKYYRMDTQVESTTHCLFRVSGNLSQLTYLA